MENEKNFLGFPIRSVADLLKKLEDEQTIGWNGVSNPPQENLLKKLIGILEDMYALAEVNNPDLDHLVEKW